MLSIAFSSRRNLSAACMGVVMAQITLLTVLAAASADLGRAVIFGGSLAGCAVANVLTAWRASDSVRMWVTFGAWATASAAMAAVGGLVFLWIFATAA